MAVSKGVNIEPCYFLVNASEKLLIDSVDSFFAINLLTNAVNHNCMAFSVGFQLVLAKKLKISVKEG